MRKPHLCKGCPEEESEDGCQLLFSWTRCASIVFLLEYPSLYRRDRGVTMLEPEDNKLLNSIIRNIGKKYGITVTHTCTYAAQRRSTPKDKPSAAVIRHCSKLWQSRFLMEYGQSLNPIVFVPLGSLASKSLGLDASNIEKTRGKVFPIHFGSFSGKAVPTYSLAKLKAKPGYMSIFQQDVVTAVKEAYSLDKTKSKSIEELSKDYIYPKTVEEVKEVCDLIIGYTDETKQPNPDKWPISVDVETNTLRAYKPGAKTLMISFAWDDQKATAIILDHDSAPYDKKQAWEHVKRVLACPKPKTFHNGKFDLQFLEEVSGAKVENFSYDTILAEHFFDEDRKGTYSLKTLAPLYCPEYEGYEERLQKVLRDKQDEFDFEKDQASAKDYIESLKPIVSFEVEDEVVEVGGDDPNYEWVVPPFFIEEGMEDLEEEYFRCRNLWFYYNATRNSKARTKALSQWRSVSKRLGLAKPMPKAATGKIKQDKGFEEVDLPTLLPYAAADADITRIIHKRGLRYAHRVGLVGDLNYMMKTVYIPASRALAKMEFLGAKVDYAALDRITQETEQIANEHKKKLFELACKEFNPGSIAQLKEVFDTAGIKFVDFTPKSGEPKTDRESIRQMHINALRDLHEHPAKTEWDPKNNTLTALGRLGMLEAYIVYSEASNFVSKFGNSLRKLSSLDGRIHTTFSLHGTVTGRLSSRNLNLQNLPKTMSKVVRPGIDGEDPKVLLGGVKVKSLLVPDSPDLLFYNVDISAAEIRVLAYYSMDRNLIEALNAGADTHLIFSTKIKHPELEPSLGDPAFREKYLYYMALKEQGDAELESFRRQVKAVVFATIYGGGPHRIAAVLGDTSDEGVERAEALQSALFKAFPSIQEYIESTYAELFAKQQVRTRLGRRRRFSLLKLSNRHKSEAKREAVNFKIQSTASDLFVSTFYKIVEDIGPKLGGTCSLTVHDSLSGTVPRARVAELKPFFQEYIVERIKQEFPWMPVEYTIDVEVGPTYGDTISVENWLTQGD